MEPDLIAADLIKPLPTLSPQDSLGRAIELFRQLPVSELPVVDEGKVVGLVREQLLLRLAQGLAEADGGRLLRQGSILEAVEQPARVAESASLEEAAEVMGQHGVGMLPVVDLFGNYAGAVLRADLISALAGAVPMPPVGGMATPLGVYLTTGKVRAGPGDLGLVLTGAALMVLNLLAIGIVRALALGVQRYTGVPLLSMVLETGAPANQQYFAHAGLWIGLTTFLQVALFMLFLRLSPLSATHAAEHQVVAAIEAGQDLSLERVRRMPRVHPRCGTNLMAMMIVVYTAAAAFMGISKTAVGSGSAAELLLVAVLVVVVAFTWRRLGPGLQQFVTTRPASDRRLFSAIRVGEALLDKQRHLRPGARSWRLWQMGLIQVMAGLLATLLLESWIGDWLLGQAGGWRWLLFHL